MPTPLKAQTQPTPTRTAIGASIVGVVLSLVAYAPASAQFFYDTATVRGREAHPGEALPGETTKLNLTLDGRSYSFAAGKTTADEIISAFGHGPTMSYNRVDGGKTLIWGTGPIDPATNKSGLTIKSFIFEIDRAGMLLSVTVRDDSNNSDIRAARNRQLAERAVQSQTKQASGERAYHNAEMALLVTAGHARCSWPVSAGDLAKADEMVKYAKQFLNGPDYNFLLAAQGNTRPVPQNEFCFGSQWRGMFNNAVHTLEATHVAAAGN